MKLCRFGAPGSERPGAIDDDGRLRDLSNSFSNFTADDLSPEGIERLSQNDLRNFPLVEGTPRYGTPYAGVSKIVGIGLNYSDHAAEAQLQVPTEPLIFMKATSALCGPNDDVIQPPRSTKLDWEVELAVIIGSMARSVSADRALDFVAGYCVLNDVSERAFQMQSSQWDKGKSCDTFAPLGPWLVTRDEVKDPQNLHLWLEVNGQRMQDGNTAKMIFDVRTLVSYVSHYMTLLPGDVIATGTPAGVGMGAKPSPIWLKQGDVVTLGISGLGQQRQQIVSA